MSLGENCNEYDSYDNYSDFDDYDDYEDLYGEYAGEKGFTKRGNSVLSKDCGNKSKKPSKPDSSNIKSSEPQKPELSASDIIGIQERESLKSEYSTVQSLFGENTVVPDEEIVSLPDQATFESFKPDEEKDFVLYALYISQKLGTNRCSYHYRLLVSEIFKNLIKYVPKNDFDEFSRVIQEKIDEHRTKVGLKEFEGEELTKDFI